MKKILALTLAAVMCLAALAGCAANKDKLPEGALSTKQLIALIDDNVVSTDDDKVVFMTIGDYEVTKPEFRANYLMIFDQYSYSYGTNWQSDETFKDTFETDVIHMIKICGTVFDYAEKNGLALTKDEFVNNILLSYQNLEEQFGEEFDKLLDDEGSTRRSLLINLVASELYNRIYEKQMTTAYAEGGDRYEIVAKTLIDAYNSANYIRAKHILIGFPEHADGSEVTADEKAETLKKAEEVLEKVNAGEDFDKLMKEYSTDPSLATQPDGYIFGEGHMVKPFEEAAYALENGEVSGLVESVHGYHIIKKLPLDDGTMDFSTQSDFAYFVSYDFNDWFMEIVDATEHTLAKNYEELVAPIIEECNKMIEDANAATESPFIGN